MPQTNGLLRIGLVLLAGLLLAGLVSPATALKADVCRSYGENNGHKACLAHAWDDQGCYWIEDPTGISRICPPPPT